MRNAAAVLSHLPSAHSPFSLRTRVLFFLGTNYYYYYYYCYDYDDYYYCTPVLSPNFFLSSSLQK